MVIIPINITREKLLEYNSEETYLARYTGIIPAKGMFKSPFRQDNHPSCSFYKSPNGILYLKDFARNEYTCDFVKAAMLRYCISDYREALYMIAEDFGIISMRQNREVVVTERPIVPDYEFKKKDITDIRVKIFNEFNNQHLGFWSKYGIDIQSLRKYRIYPIQELYVNGKYIPFGNRLCFGYFHSYTIVDEKRIEFWRIYFPGKKKFKFISNWRKDMIQGYKQLPETGKTLVITKSMKDVVCMSMFGINAIAPCSENLFVPDDILKSLKKRFRFIVVMYDNDRAGMSAMHSIREKHPELTYIWIPKKFKCKDFSDFVEMYGFEKIQSMMGEIKEFVLGRIKESYYKSKQIDIIRKLFGKENGGSLIDSGEQCEDNED